MMKTKIFLVLLLSFFFFGNTVVSSSDSKNSSRYDEYGLPLIQRDYRQNTYDNFVRADIARSLMSDGRFFSQREVQNIFRRNFGNENITVLPYRRETLMSYSRKKCVVFLKSDFVGRGNDSRTNSATINHLRKIPRFRYQLRDSLRFLSKKDYSFLNTAPAVGWSLTCFERYNEGTQLRRIVPSYQRAISAIEVVQLMLLSKPLLKGRDVVTSDRVGRSHVLVRKDLGGRITILLQNFTKQYDLFALEILPDKKR